MGKPVISRSPEAMGGTPVFSGTRVPVQTLLDYLESGESIDDFLAGFPAVNREQVIEHSTIHSTISPARIFQSSSSITEAPSDQDSRLRR